MFQVATSATRVENRTARQSNQRIRERTRASVAYYARHPEQIDRRLAELDREWDVERWLQLNSAALSLVGLGLAATRSRRWLALPCLVQGFFLQHAIQGWCPPLPFFRRIGIRTPVEIDAERHALEALRGDYDRAKDGTGALEAARRSGASETQPKRGRFIVPTAERVPQHTSDSVNERIRRETEQRVAFYADHPEQREQRLSQLAREWDVERVLETEGPTMTFAGMLLSVVLGRKWLALPIFSQSMVLLHALRGAYPLLPIFRRMGLRTQKEIGAERNAIKALRGDFEGVGNGDGPEHPEARSDRALAAARPVLHDG